MRLFWESVLEPLLVAAKPERIVEIGVDLGLTTELLATFADSRGATIDAIDPAPKLDVGEWTARHPGLTFRLGLSVDVLPGLEAVDVALIDGDHNWYSVFEELRLLEAAASGAGRLPPVVALHDVEWPYGRRDLYYDPDTVPVEHQQPHRRAGIDPQTGDIVEGAGFNRHLVHADHEGGPRNGVRTAVEDFVAASETAWRFAVLPGFHGLGLLAPEELLSSNGRLRDVFDGLTQVEVTHAFLRVLERARVASEVARQAATAALHAAAAAGAAPPAAVPEAVTDAEAQSVDAVRAALEDSRRLVTAQTNQLGGLLKQAKELRTVEAARGPDPAAAAKLAKLEAGLQAATAEVQLGRDEIARLTSQLATQATEHASRVAALEETLDGLRTQQHADALDHARERTEFEGRIEQHLRALDAANTEAAELRAAADKATSQTRAFREELEEVTRARERSDRRRAVLEEREEELEDQLAAQRRKARDSAEQRDTAVHAREAAEQHLQTERQRAEDAAARAQQAETEAVRLERLLADRETDLEQLATTRASLVSEAEDTRETLQEALDEARAQAGAARVSARELRERLEAREIESEGLEEQLRLLRQSLAQTRADAEVAHAQRASLELRISQLATQHDLALSAAATAAKAASAPAAAVEPAAEVAPASDAPAVTTPTPTDPTAGPEPAPPAGEPIDRVIAFEITEPERQAQAYFRAEYTDARGAAAPGAPEVVDAIALPAAIDLRGHLVAEHPDDLDVPSVDIVVCVHNALDDVRRCLWSILHKTDRPYRLVVVNDGSDEETTAHLREVVEMTPAVHLVENLEPPHGYTIAANLGLRAATGDYVVLLNSDTIVTPGWLDRMVACGESDPQIGIMGPLSNAASHQSIPDRKAEGGWATNPLPSFVAPDGIAKLLERTSRQLRPRFPFVNGFCFAVKRQVLDTIGYLDEELFATGYCEENDFCVRATDAGFSLAIADDAYVFHAKSKSFTPEGRKVLATRNYQIFLEKHGAERINDLVGELEEDGSLGPLRATVSDALASDAALAGALDSARHEPLSIVFVLPGLGAGGSGGSHSVYQEVNGLRRLGLDARIALRDKAFDRARAAYDDADEVFVPYSDVASLAEVTAHADVISATHYKSVATVAELCERRDDFLPAYYVQDYEPFFTAKDSADVHEAIASYTLMPDALLFAKTHWLCNIVGQRHQVHVAKVEPSIDERLYQPGGPPETSGRVRVAAMIRPRTPRRQPSATVAVLEQLVRTHGDAVEVVTFGCPIEELRRFTSEPAILDSHRGLLTRASVAELLASSNVFLDLSMYQAFGRTALEAMACGATAVVPRLGGVWEFLEHRGNGIAVDAFEPLEAVLALGELVEDRALLEQLQLRAVTKGAEYTVMRAALSEYLVFAREHANRFGNQRTTV